MLPSVISPPSYSPAVLSRQKFFGYAREIFGGEGFTIRPVLLRPKSRGTITLQSRNPDHHPLIDPKLLSHPDDVKTLVEGKGVFSLFLYILAEYILLLYITCLISCFHLYRFITIIFCNSIPFIMIHPFSECCICIPCIYNDLRFNDLCTLKFRIWGKNTKSLSN